MENRFFAKIHRFTKIFETTFSSETFLKFREFFRNFRKIKESSLIFGNLVLTNFFSVKRRLWFGSKNLKKRPFFKDFSEIPYLSSRFYKFVQVPKFGKLRNFRF